ncbi:phosphoadenylyl-sulfate reductase [Histidinibacterium aquaticum]|uniref:Adenosine 5'-phosphosulfate reductase n=1 Tax=Histidinibacterium aquaticum TaxID=2613962 RepID=A0A5J5GNJ9_9RHOB|nr:phosphoadenylyl-sulfate reductase [Histidinibacterium aquaticum]KAA9009114.1 phosphoadenylyl-sulfate reductase [Histidinibacterium aquaticum]
MPLDLSSRVSDLNDRYRHHGATAVLERALTDPDVGDIALVSSFGAESVALLHLVSVIDRRVPVLFIDTEMLFPETLTYQSELAVKLNLSDLRIVRARLADTLAEDPRGDLHKSNPDACCALRKTVPLQRALEGFDGWITGRKRYQGSSRQDLQFFEAEEATGRIKVNPLAHWTSEDVQDYITENRLPRHPLVSRGYPSIGCLPCTSKVEEGEDPRAGRWRGQDKDECGIHFVDGKIVRGPKPEAA